MSKKSRGFFDLHGQAKTLGQNKVVAKLNSWRWRDEFLLACLVVFMAVCNFVWRQLETRPPHWDMSYHLINSKAYFDTFKAGHLKALLMDYHYYPPLVYILAIIPYSIWGISVLSAVWVNVLFLAILAFSTYGIGKVLYSRQTGLLAGLFVMSSPMVVSQFKDFQLDAPLTAMVALSIYLLIRSDYFKQRWWSIFLGISLGFGLLTKWTFPFILALPLTAAAVTAGVRCLKSQEYDWIFNLAFAALIAYAIASPWYLPNLHQLHIDLASNGVAQGAREGDPAIGSLASGLYYFNDLLNIQLYLLPAVLLVGGVVATFRRRDLLRQSLYPFALIIGTIVFFTMLRNKDARYTLPILPAVAVLAVAWLKDLKKRRILAASGVIYSIVSFWAISFGIKLLPQRSAFNIGSIPVVVFAQQGYIIGAPSKEQWHEEEIFKIVGAESERRTLAYSGPDTIWFNNLSLNYFARIYGVGLTQLDEAQYLAVRSESNIQTPAGFELMQQWSLPDNTQLKLFKRTSPPKV